MSVLPKKGLVIAAAATLAIAALSRLTFMGGAGTASVSEAIQYLRTLPQNEPLTAAQLITVLENLEREEETQSEESSLSSAEMSSEASAAAYQGPVQETVWTAPASSSEMSSEAAETAGQEPAQEAAASAPEETQQEQASSSSSEMSSEASSEASAPRQEPTLWEWLFGSNPEGPAPNAADVYDTASSSSSSAEAETSVFDIGAASFDQTTQEEEEQADSASSIVTGTCLGKTDSQTMADGRTLYLADSSEQLNICDLRVRNADGTDDLLFRNAYAFNLSPNREQVVVESYEENRYLQTCVLKDLKKDHCSVIAPQIYPSIHNGPDADIGQVAVDDAGEYVLYGIGQNPKTYWIMKPIAAYPGPGEEFQFAEDPEYAVLFPSDSLPANAVTARSFAFGAKDGGAVEAVRLQSGGYYFSAR